MRNNAIYPSEKWINLGLEWNIYIYIRILSKGAFGMFSSFFFMFVGVWSFSRQWLLAGPSPFSVNVNMSFCGDITCWVEARQWQQLGFKLQPQKHISLVFLVPHTHTLISKWKCTPSSLFLPLEPDRIIFSCRGEQMHTMYSHCCRCWCWRHRHHHHHVLR